MTPEDATFILSHDSGMACELARLSLFFDNSMWKTLLDAGLPAAIRKNHGARSSLFYTLGCMKNTDNAVTVLNAVLNDLNPKQRQTLFSSEKKGSVVVSEWLSAVGSVTGQNLDALGSSNEAPTTTFNASAAHFRALVGAIQAFGIEPNTAYQATGRKNAKYDASVFSETLTALLSMAKDSPFRVQTMQQMDLMWSISPKLDNATKLRVMGDSSTDRAEMVVTLFESKRWAHREEWLTISGHSRVNKETLAYMQAKLAMAAVQDVADLAAHLKAPKSL